MFQTIDLLELIQFLIWGRPVQYCVTFWISFVFPRNKDLLDLEETLGIIYEWTNFVGNEVKVQKDREIYLQLFNYFGLLPLSQCFSHYPNHFVVVSPQSSNHLEVREIISFSAQNQTYSMFHKYLTGSLFTLLSRSIHCKTSLNNKYHWGISIKNLFQID